MKRPPPPSKLSVKIAQMLVDMGMELDDDISPELCSIERIRAGRHWKAAGAWSWRLTRYDSFGTPFKEGDIGSTFPANKIAKGFEIYRDPDKRMSTELIPKEAQNG